MIRLQQLLRGRLQGGVLPLVLGISLIIAILCSSLILLVEYYQLEARRMAINLELSRNAESGIQFLMAANTNTSQRIDLFQTGKDSAVISKESWGLYDVLTSTAFRGAHSVTRIGLSAEITDTLHQSTLYLAESNSPLYLAGESKIEGTVYLPGGIARPASLLGSEFKGKTLIDGPKRSSNRQLPALKPSLQSRFNNLGEYPDSVFTSIKFLDYLPDSVCQLFSSDDVLYSKTDFELELSGYLKGKIVVISGKRIVVTSDARLEDIILYAPSIIVKQGFRGRLQIVASESILIEEDVNLDYPSALVLWTGNKEGKIEMNKNSHLAGDVLVDVQHEKNQARIFLLQPLATLEGFAHINGSVQLFGNLYGHLSCRDFSLNSGGETRGNYVLDATMNYKKKPEWLNASGLWNSRRSEIIQWLY